MKSEFNGLFCNALYSIHLYNSSIFSLSRHNKSIDYICYKSPIQYPFMSMGVFPLAGIGPKSRMIFLDRQMTTIMAVQNQKSDCFIMNVKMHVCVFVLYIIVVWSYLHRNTHKWWCMKSFNILLSNFTQIKPTQVYFWFILAEWRDFSLTNSSPCPKYLRFISHHNSVNFYRVLHFIQYQNGVKSSELSRRCLTLHNNITRQYWTGRA